MIEPFPELFWNHKHDMTILLHPGKKSSIYIIYPFTCVYLCTGETKTALATEGNLLHLTALKAPERHKSIFQISASQHLLDRLIVILYLISRIHLLKLRPVVYEYLFKYILIVIWAHAHKIYNSVLKYNYFIHNRDFRKKGNSYTINVKYLLFPKIALFNILIDKKFFCIARQNNFPCFHNISSMCNT